MPRFARCVFAVFLAVSFLSSSLTCQAAAPETAAAAFILMEAGSGRVLAARNETQERSIASTTKIMTCLVALEHSELTEQVTVKREHLREGSSMYLLEGETLTMEELLYGLMLPSGNDAAECIADTGAYASLGGPVLERACTHGAGPYQYEAYEIDGWAYYTNNPPAGAFRGFGVTQTCFCIETLMNEMADKVGISPWEIRYRNAIRPGGVLPNGQIVDGSTGLVETLEAVKPYYDEAVKNGDPVGLACAMKNAGVGVGIPDTGRVRLTVREGKLHIFAGASCIGQGLGTVLTQTVCGETGIPRENVVYERSNTWIAPDSGTTSGSRQTLFTGEACIRACQDLKKALEEHSLADLEGQEFYGEYLGKTDPLGADVPNPVSHIAYGYATQLCVLDKDTGRIKRMVAAHDVGKAVNPLSVEGQIEGGVVMSMGYALTERYPIDENCRPTVKFGTLGLFRANQIPEIKPIIVEKPGLNVGGGAIGIGEITSIPTAPAIAEAYRRYDGELRTELPLKNTPYAKK